MSSNIISYLFHYKQLVAPVILAMLGFSLYLAIPITAQEQSTAAVTKPNSRSAKTQTFKVYFLSPKNHKLVPVFRASSLPDTKTPEAFLKTALNDLLAQPQQKTLISAIPTGTKLVDLKIKADRIVKMEDGQLIIGSASPLPSRGDNKAIK
jgi:spore germination protein GerM